MFDLGPADIIDMGLYLLQTPGSDRFLLKPRRKMKHILQRMEVGIYVPNVF